MAPLPDSVAGCRAYYTLGKTVILNAVKCNLGFDNTMPRQSTGCPKKLNLILRLNVGAVDTSMTKMLVPPDSRDIFKSFGTLIDCSYALIN